jgi:hypothetical protein
MFNSGAYSGTLEHFGSLRVLIEQNYITKEQHFYGISAGAYIALIAFLYVNNKITITDIDDIQSNFISCMRRSSYTDPMPCMFELIEYMKRYVYPNLYKDISKRVHIGITTRKGFRWFTKFRSNYDLFHFFICSCNLSCLSTYTYAYLDGYYSYSPFVHLPRHTMIIQTTYRPPICLIPITMEFIINYLLQSGYNKTKIEIVRYSQLGSNKIMFVENYNYLFWFDLHMRNIIINPIWDIKLKTLFHDNIGG